MWLLAGLINETIDMGWVQHLKEPLKNIISSEGKKETPTNWTYFKLLKSVIHGKQCKVLFREVEGKPWGGRGFLKGGEQFIPHSHMGTIYSHLWGTGNILKLIMFLPPFSPLLSCLQSKVKAYPASPVTGTECTSEATRWGKEEWNEISSVVCDSL